MDRTHALEYAATAVGRAATLARQAEQYAHVSGSTRATQFAAAAGSWADTARAYAALAAVMPEPTTDQQQTTEV